jgi:tetratricopeptide (TPR) repeat protein
VSFAQFLMEGGAEAGGARIRALLEQGVRFFPQDVQFLNNLGYAYSLAKEDGKAEEVYARLLRLKPETAVAERNLRASLARSGHPEPEVLGHVQEFRKLEARLEAKVYDAESLRLAREAAGRFPASLACKLYLANLLLIQGDAGASEELFRQVLAAEPNNVPALLNLGQALKRLGKAPEAAEQFRRALSLEPGNALAKQALSSLR